MAGIPAIAEDLRDLLRAFIAHEVRFLVVGGYALAVHGHPRATGDLDVWIECSEPNATRAFAALGEFGAPLGDLAATDLATPGTVYQIGRDALLANKRALGRPRDLADVEMLEGDDGD